MHLKLAYPLSTILILKYLIKVVFSPLVGCYDLNSAIFSLTRSRGEYLRLVGILEIVKVKLRWLGAVLHFPCKFGICIIIS